MRQFLDKLATFILRFIPAFLMLSVPLFFLPTTPDYFSFNKQFLVFTLASVSLVAYLIRTLTRGKIHLSLSASLLPIFLLMVAYIVPSVWMHTNPRAALFGPTAFIVSLGIIFITVTSTQKNSLVIKSTITTLVTSAVLLSIAGILHNFGLLYKIFPYDILKNSLFTPSGSPFFTLLFLIPISIATLTYTFYSKNWIIKPILFSSAIIMIIGIFLSIKVLMPQTGRPGLIILPLSAGWSIAMDTFKNPRTAVFGTGPDNFANTFTRFRPAYLNMNKDFWSIRFNNSTTEALTILTVTGILGLVTFTLFTILPIIQVLKKIKNHNDPEMVFVASLAIISTLIFFIAPSNIISYCLIITSAALITIKLKTINSHNVKDVQIGITADEVSQNNIYTDLTQDTKQIQLPVLSWLLTGMSIVLLAVFWTRAVNIYRAALVINEASKLIKTDPQKSYEKQLEAANLDPYNPYYKINLSQTYLAVANNLLSKKDATTEEKQRAIEFANQAINESKAAAALDPANEQVWENFANISRQLAILKVEGAIDWTLATYTQAISTDPTNPALRVQLGTFYYLLGDNDNAIKVLDQAIELKPDWNVTYFNQSQIYKTKKDYPRALAYMQAGLKYTPSSSEDISKIQDEIKSLEKLIPPSATQSAQKVN